MNSAKGFDMMMVRLGNRKETSLRADLVDELNAKIAERERGKFLPWFLETRHSESLTVGQEYLDLPDDFLREAEDGIVKLTHPDTGASKELKKVYVEDLERVYMDADPDWPEGYAIYGNRFYFAPAPNAAYVINFRYYRKSVVVTDSANETATDWFGNAFNYISYDTLADVAANLLQDDEMAMKFRTLAAEARRELFEYSESRQHVNADYHIGGMN